MDHMAGLMVRAQLRPVGMVRGSNLLETRYEATGAYEVAVIFQDPAQLRASTQPPHLVPVKVVATREEGEAYIQALLGQCPGDRLPLSAQEDTA